eukprot:sb/3461625/
MSENSGGDDPSSNRRPQRGRYRDTGPHHGGHRDTYRRPVNNTESRQHRRPEHLNESGEFRRPEHENGNGQHHRPDHPSESRRKRRPEHQNQNRQHRRPEHQHENGQHHRPEHQNGNGPNHRFEHPNETGHHHRPDHQNGTGPNRPPEHQNGFTNGVNGSSEKVSHRRPNRRGRPRGKQPRKEVPRIYDYEDQAESLRSHIESNTSECMVCYEYINAFCATYSCFRCYNIFHLACVRQWASAKLNDDSVPIREDTPRNWTCPACQVPSATLPLRYVCFCEAVINPRYTPLNLPHSCGEKCSRVRANCKHPCPQFCHPGKCPECLILVTSHCQCGVQSSTVRCSQRKDAIRCDRVCGRTLNCGVHTCTTVCHTPGTCAPCEVQRELPCYCGRAVRSLVCGTEKSSEKSTHIGYWSCGTPCNQLLSCGNHKCNRTCHSGPCPPCVTDVTSTTTCPCGKTRLDKLQTTPRTSCLDPVPTCKKICRKVLECGSEAGHVCQSVCHEGPCPDCEDKSVVSCRCEITTQSIACSEIPADGVRCGKICYKKKSCGRHRCTIECCLEDNHVCMYPCGKTLSCQEHKCEDLCHKGHCMPCLESNFNEVFCTCGATRLEPPIACGTAPPKCDLPCTREHSCPHPFDHTCHYDPTCPPCVQLVNKLCMGGHKVRYNVPCHLNDISCGEPCKRPLSCDMHVCERPCHKDPCDTGKCEKPCKIKRELCDHICAAKCHPGTECPKTVCFARMPVTCPCQRRKVTILCFKGATFAPSDTKKFMTKLRSANLAVLHADLVEYMKTGAVACEEACFVEERNRKLAEGLGLVNVAVDNIVAPNYSEFLKEQARSNKSFVIEIEEQFEVVIMKYKRRNETSDSLNRVSCIYHDFKPMNKDKRRLIHELAEHYKITTQSFDPDPQRNVQIRVDYQSSVPGVKLSQYMLVKRSFVGSSKPIPKPVGSRSTAVEEVPELKSLVLQDPKQVAENWEEMCDEDDVVVVRVGLIME